MSSSSNELPIVNESQNLQQQQEQEALQKRMSEIGRKLLVLSGKGGVGKSTVAANLAVSLAEAGKNVGLLDVDVHGPSIPGMMGLEGRPVRMAAEGAFLGGPRPGRSHKGPRSARRRVRARRSARGFRQGPLVSRTHGMALGPAAFCSHLPAMGMGGSGANGRRFPSGRLRPACR